MTNSTFLIAVVDDDPSILKGLSSLLRSEGFLVETFGNAEAFLESSAFHLASCVVTDIQMPGMDGLSLQRAVRNVRADLPVIVITAFEDASTRVKALAGGAREILIKPFPAERLLSALALALTTHEE